MKKALASHVPILLLVILVLFVIYSPQAWAQNIKNPAPGYFTEAPGTDFPSIIQFIIKAVLGLAGTVSVVFIIIGGFQYITSRGNEEQAETGKKTLTNAIIGLVIVILSYVIVVIIINALAKTQ